MATASVPPCRAPIALSERSNEKHHPGLEGGSSWLFYNRSWRQRNKKCANHLLAEVLNRAERPHPLRFSCTRCRDGAGGCFGRLLRRDGVSRRLDPPWVFIRISCVRVTCQALRTLSWCCPSVEGTREVGPCGCWSLQASPSRRDMKQNPEIRCLEMIGWSTVSLK